MVEVWGSNWDSGSRNGRQMKDSPNRWLLSASLCKIVFWLCVTIMALALGVQGFILYLRDFVTPNPLPLEFMISDWIWLLLVISFLLYFKKPIATIVAGCLAFIVWSVLLEKFADDHTVVWFLYRHSLLLLFIAAAQVGFLFRKKSDDARSPLNAVG